MEDKMRDVIGKIVVELLAETLKNIGTADSATQAIINTKPEFDQALSAICELFEEKEKEVGEWKEIALQRIDTQRLICPQCQKATYGSELYVAQHQLARYKEGLEKILNCQNQQIYVKDIIAIARKCLEGK